MESQHGGGGSTLSLQLSLSLKLLKQETSFKKKRQALDSRASPVNSAERLQTPIFSNSAKKPKRKEHFLTQFCGQHNLDIKSR